MLKNTRHTYGIIAQWLHWFMAVLLIAMFVLAYYMMDLGDAATKKPFYDLHKATGLLLLGLVLLRLLWRFINLQPQLPTSMPQWEQISAKLNVVALYMLMLAMPITGFFMSSLGGRQISFYGLFTIAPLMYNKAIAGIFKNGHVIASYIFIAIFALHVLGALYHHFFLKDNILKRMLSRSLKPEKLQN